MQLDRRGRLRPPPWLLPFLDLLAQNAYLVADLVGYGVAALVLPSSQPTARWALVVVAEVTLVAGSMAVRGFHPPTSANFGVVAILSTAYGTAQWSPTSNKAALLMSVVATGAYMYWENGRRRRLTRFVVAHNGVDQTEGVREAWTLSGLPPMRLTRGGRARAEAVWRMPIPVSADQVEPSSSRSVSIVEFAEHGLVGAHSSHASLMVLRDDRWAFPNTVVQASGVRDKAMNALAWRSLELESEAFNRRFDVRSEEVARGYELLSAAMQERLADSHALAWEFSGDALVRASRPLDSRLLPSAIAELEAVAAAIPGAFVEDGVRAGGHSHVQVRAVLTPAQAPVRSGLLWLLLLPMALIALSMTAGLASASSRNELAKEGALGAMFLAGLVAWTLTWLLAREIRKRRRQKRAG